MSNSKYDVARVGFARKEIDWVNDVFWVMLLNAEYVVDLNAHRLLSDLTPAARLMDFGPLGNRDVDDEGYCLGGPISVTRSTTNTQATQLVIYKRVELDMTQSIPVLHCSQVGGLPLRFNRDFFRIEWPDSRVFRS